MRSSFWKTLLLIIGVGLNIVIANAQKTDSVPRYKQFPFVPSFKLMKTDSSIFVMKDVVPQKSAAVVVVFSPLCSHCQHQAQEITSHMKDLSDVTFLFATTYPLSDIQTFINDYGLDRFPNIHIGQDRGAYLGAYYQIKGIPGVYVYNKKGNLTAAYSTNVKAETLVKALSK